ncbi:glycosyltransferase family 2 protein [Nitrososphaera sp.]|uniref:glycosyltransferase family 2 protein n=1 Tax=Nitrososphaera sp. TaxID=1971748 RepID=UPI00317BE91A
MGSYFAIVTCRNSEANIERALLSLKAQTVKPAYVIVIDDGSRDRTPEMLKRLQAGWPDLHVITNPDLGYDIARVVSNWNKALTYARQNGLPATDYHMISADDVVYEKDYVEKLMRRMDLGEIAVASGNYGEHGAVTPHGAGRLVSNRFFEKRHGLYPEKMGYESLVLHTAVQQGYSCAVFDDARFEHVRPLGSNHHFYEFGASMKTLGYHPLFVLGRFALYFATGRPIGRLGALYMLYYYLSYRPKDTGYNSMHDSDVRRFIRRHQLKRIKSRLGVA